LAVLTVCVGCWVAEERDSGQKIFGGDVGANLAGRRGGVEQVAEDGSESLEEVAGQGVEGGVA
jgi:hypothetical protein